MRIDQAKKANNPDFSLILPCYNESSHIVQSIQDIISILETSEYSYEIILYDDKSSDNTANLINKISKQYDHIICFYHKKNVGRGGTVRDGILKAKGNIVGFIDIDIEVSPDYILRFIKTIQERQADVVIANRKYPMSFFPINAFIRTILSEGYALMIRKLLNLSIQDTEAGYKFFDKKKILPILAEIEDQHWFWDTEIIARSILHGLKIKEIPVLFLRNAEKQSTVKLIPDIIAYIKAIKKYKKSLVNSSK